jgi:ADP-heptose:LPS heptosyltransferase
VLFAEEDDQDAVGEFIERNPQHEIISFFEHDLELVFGALSWCQAFVTSDSGLMHAAAALGVPTWGLFGPTHPALGFAPRGREAHAVHSGIFCSPCSRHGKTQCYRRHRYCFEQINVAKIAQGIARQLKLESDT